MKPCPCGGELYLNYSLRSGYCLWCTVCHKTVTKEYWERWEPVLEWVHGIKSLPRCPLCKLPVEVLEPDSETPMVKCHLPGTFNCLGGKTYTIEEWLEKAPPQLFAIKRLATRWKKDQPEWKKPREQLLRAIKRDAIR